MDRVDEDASDIELVERTRLGQSRAFGALWRRHVRDVTVAVASFVSLDSEDIVQEAFLRILKQIRSGHGPRTDFRAYAIMAARRVAMNMVRSRTGQEIVGVPTDARAVVDQLMPDPAEQIVDERFVRHIFDGLPRRWQDVLWYREVQELPIKDVGERLGINENATQALLRRAREGLKQEWIAANLASQTDLPRECSWVRQRLPKYVRGMLSALMRHRILDHLRVCTACTRAEVAARAL